MEILLKVETDVDEQGLIQLIVPSEEALKIAKAIKAMLDFAGFDTVLTDMRNSKEDVSTLE